MIRTYRGKFSGQVVEALRWNGYVGELRPWLQRFGSLPMVLSNPLVLLDSWYGDQRVYVGDFIIQSDGAFTRQTPRDFVRIWQLVDDSDALVFQTDEEQLDAGVQVRWEHHQAPPAQMEIL